MSQGVGVEQGIQIVSPSHLGRRALFDTALPQRKIEQPYDLFCEKLQRLSENDK